MTLSREKANHTAKHQGLGGGWLEEQARAKATSFRSASSAGFQVRSLHKTRIQFALGYDEHWRRASHRLPERARNSQAQVHGHLGRRGHDRDQGFDALRRAIRVAITFGSVPKREMLRSMSARTQARHDDAVLARTKDVAIREAGVCVRTHGMLPALRAVGEKQEIQLVPLAAVHPRPAC
jgi:hypothetical protein